MSITVSTPSRLCLFGEHLDYLSLEVVTMAVNLRFYACIDKRNDGLVKVRIKDSSINTLNQVNVDHKYEEIIFNAGETITYRHHRDYFRSAVNVIKKRGYDVSCGFDVIMDSEIPIGKGMCSSSTMIVAFIKAVLEVIDADIKDSRDDIVEMAYQAEVAEFNEPGGKMDHIASVYGGICHFDFESISHPVVQTLHDIPEGDFILVDSNEQKDTIKVLRNAKEPVIKALKDLPSIREMYGNREFDEKISHLEENLKIPLMAAMNNYAILKQFLEGHENHMIDDSQFGALLKNHHQNLNEGLGISTVAIEKILSLAYEHGALGGKINGSGGGGCCYVFCKKEKTKEIISAINQAGYQTKVVIPAEGVKVEEKI
ncbi:MAG: hypothetical protein JXQ23_13935 [Clostridia bacterium]|nr:hypothetical protein [Clostridia bacterium]